MPPNSKTRRHSGRTCTFVDDRDYPIQIPSYNEWDSYRDGQRDRSTQIKKIYPGEFRDEEEYWRRRRQRDKINKHLQIRRVRKNEIQTAV